MSSEGTVVGANLKSRPTPKYPIGDKNGSQAGQDEPPGPPKSSEVNAPVILGVVVGVVTALLLLGLIWCICYRKRRKRNQENARNQEDTRSNTPPRHVFREEDAGGVFEYLPPQYNEDWDRNGSTPPVSMPTGESYDPSLDSLASRRPLVASGSDGGRNEDLSPLKRAYLRTFGRSRLQPAGVARRPGTLLEEYKRMAGGQGSIQQPPRRDPDSKDQ